MHPRPNTWRAKWPRILKLTQSLAKLCPKMLLLVVWGSENYSIMYESYRLTDQLVVVLVHDFVPALSWRVDVWGEWAEVQIEGSKSDVGTYSLLTRFFNEELWVGRKPSGSQEWKRLRWKCWFMGIARTKKDYLPFERIWLVERWQMSESDIFQSLVVRDRNKMPSEKVTIHA